MKQLKTFYPLLLIAFLAISVIACSDDDDVSSNNNDNQNPPPSKNEKLLIGTWVSDYIEISYFINDSLVYKGTDSGDEETYVTFREDNTVIAQEGKGDNAEIDTAGYKVISDDILRLYELGDEEDFDDFEFYVTESNLQLRTTDEWEEDGDEHKHDIIIFLERQ